MPTVRHRISNCARGDKSRVHDLKSCRSGGRLETHRPRESLRGGFFSAARSEGPDKAAGRVGANTVKGVWHQHESAVKQVC